MELNTTIVLAIACYLLPFGIEARTGSSNHKKYIADNGDKLSSWKVFVLRNHIVIWLIYSTILLTSIIIFVNIHNSSVILAKIFSWVLLILSIMLGCSIMSWRAWIDKI